MTVGSGDDVGCALGEVGSLPGQDLPIITAAIAIISAAMITISIRIVFSKFISFLSFQKLCSNIITDFEDSGIIFYVEFRIIDCIILKKQFLLDFLSFVGII